MYRVPQRGKCSGVYVVRTDVQTGAGTELIIIGEEFADEVEKFEGKDGLFLFQI